MAAMFVAMVMACTDEARGRARGDPQPRARARLHPRLVAPSENAPPARAQLRGARPGWAALRLAPSGRGQAARRARSARQDRRRAPRLHDVGGASGYRPSRGSSRPADLRRRRQVDGRGRPGLGHRRQGPGSVLVDAHRLEYAIDALIENAVTATVTGGRVAVTAERQGDLVFIRIADDGRGIGRCSRAHLRALLDPGRTKRAEWNRARSGDREGDRRCARRRRDSPELTGGSRVHDHARSGPRPGYRANRYETRRDIRAAGRFVCARGKGTPPATRSIRTARRGRSRRA